MRPESETAPSSPGASRPLSPSLAESARRYQGLPCGSAPGVPLSALWTRALKDRRLTPGFPSQGRQHRPEPTLGGQRSKNSPVSTAGSANMEACAGQAEPRMCERAAGRGLWPNGAPAPSPVAASGQQPVGSTSQRASRRDVAWSCHLSGFFGRRKSTFV